MSLHEHTYKPYGSPSFKNSDEIRIAVNFQDLILDISESYIYIEGKFTPNDATKTCYLSNNALAFSFDEIRYEMGGEQVCMVRKPGITTTMKSMISYGESNMKFLETIGWGLDGGKQVLLDKASNVSSGKLPLEYLMGFAEDYCRGILNIKQELILIIARSFKNSYIGEVDADVEINKIEWKIRHVMPTDKQKLKLLTRLNRSSTAKVKIAYRMWDLYELPTIRETASDIWAVKTTNSLERPRYIIIGFQNTDNTDNGSEDITQFTHAGVSNIRLYLNSEVYPYERWNLDFDKKLDAVAYHAYDNFQRSYYGKDMSEPMMSIEEFRKNPLFIIDCNHQPDAMKSSTVDIKLDESELPSIQNFYNKLNDTNISDDDYAHARKVWKSLELKSLGEYSDLYMRTDILLLADVMENFSASSLKTYGLDPAWYYTMPGYTWDCMLEYTGCKLQIIKDIDMVMFVEQAIRGGVSVCCNRANRMDLMLALSNTVTSSCKLSAFFVWKNTITYLGLSNAEHVLTDQISMVDPCVSAGSSCNSHRRNGIIIGSSALIRVNNCNFMSSLGVRCGTFKLMLSIVILAIL
ncbi:unnamed protein product [Phaedon cochleariae]|uniref:Double jelly roll-like domain-containing protein n=1 Tax=Phaedon cochleariae TaxID=80249 RepID=A0A9N9SF07_PHACE|nr:unnamed protein product [Phaedon cochleariae]